MKDISSCKVLVTARSFGTGDSALKGDLESAVGEVVYNPFGRAFSYEDFEKYLPGVDGLIAGVDVIDARVLGLANRLRVIARYGAGVDQVDIQFAQDRGIVVTNTPGANAAAVAELAFGMMLSLARRIPEAVAATRAGKWPRVDGVSLQGQVLGLMGFGAVGQEMARRAAGFGMVILAYDPAPLESAALELGVRLCSPEEVLEQSDFLSLHMPLTDETQGFLNSETIPFLKRGAFLINTARNGLVEETALLQALNKGFIKGAALDCFSKEPPDPDSSLLKHPAVLVTPHMGAHTDGAVNKMGRMALENCLAVLRGLEPPNRVLR
ncbi:MAG: phosphoglycerate dehydrogenase [Anaerolineales bacterium]|nr:phosphoglycerate dehydrogenase [Anaerolineales bacterium]